MVAGWRPGGGRRRRAIVMSMYPKKKRARPALGGWGAGRAPVAGEAGYGVCSIRNAWALRDWLLPAVVMLRSARAALASLAVRAPSAPGADGARVGPLGHKPFEIFDLI